MLYNYRKNSLDKVTFLLKTGGQIERPDVNFIFQEMFTSSTKYYFKTNQIKKIIYLTENTLNIKNLIMKRNKPLTYLIFIIIFIGLFKHLFAGSMITIGPGIRKLREDNFKSSWLYSGEITFAYITGDQQSAADSLPAFLWATGGCHVFETDNSAINKYVYYGEIGIYNVGFGYTSKISDIDYYHLFVGLPIPLSATANSNFLPYLMLYMRRGWGREDRSQKFLEYGIMAKIGFEIF